MANIIGFHMTLCGGLESRTAFFNVFKSRDGFTGGGVHLPLALARGGAGGMRYSNLSNNMMISKL